MPIDPDLSPSASFFTFYAFLQLWFHIYIAQVLIQRLQTLIIFYYQLENLQRVDIADYVQSPFQVLIIIAFG